MRLLPANSAACDATPNVNRGTASNQPQPCCVFFSCVGIPVLDRGSEAPSWLKPRTWSTQAMSTHTAHKSATACRLQNHSTSGDREAAQDTPTRKGTTVQEVGVGVASRNPPPCSPHRLPTDPSCGLDVHTYMCAQKTAHVTDGQRREEFILCASIRFLGRKAAETRTTMREAKYETRARRSSRLKSKRWSGFLLRYQSAPTTGMVPPGNRGTSPRRYAQN